MNNNTVSPEQDLLELKCHEDYKWAALEISQLRTLINEYKDAEHRAVKLHGEVLRENRQLQTAIRNMQQAEIELRSQIREWRDTAYNCGYTGNE